MWNGYSMEKNVDAIRPLSGNLKGGDLLRLSGMNKLAGVLATAFLAIFGLVGVVSLVAWTMARS
jgi:hypothetical protein